MFGADGTRAVMFEVADYYRRPAVRRRMLEFLGGDQPANVTAMYLSRCDLGNPYDFSPRRPRELDLFLEQGLDVGRSLWDRRFLLVHLDLEYVNFDFPAEPYLDPQRTFALQQPLVVALSELLAGFGLEPLHLLSGRGHHYVWQVPADSEVFRELTELVALPAHLAELYRRPQPPHGEPVALGHGRAFAGLALVVEYLAHCIKERAAAACVLPVELTAVKVGPQQRGREMVSVDISEYADPLNLRMIRLPFSAYLKPWRQYGIMHPGGEGRIPLMFAIPVAASDSEQMVAVMRDAGRAAALAEEVEVGIPVQAAATARLLAAYRRSRLAAFHRFFYAAGHDLPEQWPGGYDLLPMSRLPPCVVRILRRPNDLLLQPAAIRQVVTALLALDWHPRHIAGLIRSKYERDYGWGGKWYLYDAASRADFYTRVFAGLIATGLDRLQDFNCVSAREKGLCLNDGGACALEELRNTLLARIEQ
ncbi:hypothetical protein [Desulfurivibrio alkaliphilus]|uniref:Uncharacterized protein n=1 Tax=Desulfurivibrio alkaliphilus (strain DSM 19089 / UNIQEM U267 / AHT2) TaxID=589865 RepID=D6Z300_DESAT|nr:hypothetical protein [Desulfurivibrio alkaliphilus]ADH85925.1 hypothetical protein DaAHT2_1228 [Desulfurivibrio alkaliphilus AHT 2]